MTPALCYVAGAFSAPTRAEVEANIRHAESWGLKLAAIGAFPIVPHCLTSHPDYETVQSYNFYISGTLALLRKCDAILLIPGWEHSAGARGERDEMLRLIRPVFVAATEWEKLKRWIGPAGRGAE